MWLRATLSLIVLVPWASLVCAQTTGKIAGTVRDAESGEKLASANVVVYGTRTGTVADAEGYYVILNLPPGVYQITATLVGYTPVNIVNVRVAIDQTTNLDIAMHAQAVEAGEVITIGRRPIVQRDVAASRANIEIADVEKLPVSTVQSAVGLQAGIQGLSVRGGYASETAFVLDGQNLRDERTNTPYTGISLLSIQEMQVQTGGFNAEYGNIRSGVINVVTKEGSVSGYNFGILGRYSPVGPKHFGPSIYDRDSYWMRPYLDDPVAWLGTQAINPATNAPYWDAWTQKQYPSFEGWNALAAKYMKNGDPKRVLSPEAMQQLFLFERRKQAEVAKSDFDLDMGFGGPVPFVSAYAGNLRFFASYRQSRNVYLIPLSDDAYRDYNGQLKLTSDIAGGMKLTVEGLLGRNSGTTNNNDGSPGMFVTPDDIGSALNRVSYIDTRIFATDYWAPTSTKYLNLGVKLSHVLSTTAFYDASVSLFRSEYHTNPGRYRDTSRIYAFGNGYFVDEAPFGFDSLPNPASGMADIRFGVGFSNSRDTSVVTTYTAKFDLTTQLGRFNEVKAGFELTSTNSDVHYGLYDAFLKDGTFATSWHRYPLKGALYAQDKLEFEGMVANLGLRMDYLNPGGDWYVYGPYTLAFSSTQAPYLDTILTKEPVKKQILLSPRLGISFPITDDAKLFFNYGHFRQQPQNPENLFLLLRSSFNNAITNIGDPNAPLPWTIAYELGYEQSLLGDYLVRVAAYYKDIKNEALPVNYVNRNATVEYTLSTSHAYRDIRGFELSVQKNRGNWIQGFANYTYSVATAGYFGLSLYSQDANEQRQIERRIVYQEKPIPAPYARLNVDAFTPAEFGPRFLDFSLLGDWRLNIVGSWSSGNYFTWSGGADIPGVQYNVQWVDYLNFDLRLSKNFQIGRLSLQFFMDITNVLNTKHMTTYGFVTAADYNDYMESLHLPAFAPEIDRQLGYINIPGDDKPGYYRKEGVAFQPIVGIGKHEELYNAQNQNTRPFYYVKTEGLFYQLVNGTWQTVDPSRLKQVLDDKAYIDMPNMDTFTFLNPRKLFFGLRLGFDL